MSKPEKYYIYNIISEILGEQTGQLYMKEGYDKSLAERYIDMDEITEYAGEIEITGATYNVPPIFRVTGELE